MSHVVQLGPDGVIEARFSGDVTVAEREAAMQKIVACHERSGASRLLADFTAANALVDADDVLDRYAARLANQPVLRRLRIAYVGTPAQTGNVEAIAALRGYFYQRFPHREAALSWLAA